MHALVRAAFSRLKLLDPEAEEAKLADSPEPSESDVKMEVTSGPSTPVLPPAETEAPAETVNGSTTQPHSQPVPPQERIPCELA